MPRVRVPDNAPIEGVPIQCVGGMAHDNIVPYTGMNLNYVVPPEGGIGEMEELDLNKVKDIHRYRLREIEHVITGEKLWVYWCLDDPKYPIV